MKPIVPALALLALLTAGSAAAQPTEEQLAQWRAMREARGESPWPRPPEGASQEEKRAFYQKRAAERAAVEAATGAADHSAPAPTQPAATAPGIKADAKPAGKAAVPPAPTIAASSGNPMRGAGMPPGMRGGVLWLADTPPQRGENAPPRRGGGMAMGGGHDHGGPPTKRLWLRTGADPQKSPFARTEADALVETILATPRKPEGEPLGLPEEAYKGMAFEMPAQGFYRLYVTTRRLQGDTLNVGVAKAEVGNFTHDAEDDERARGMAGPRVLESAAIEIVRQRQPKEGPFSQVRAGSEQTFIVLQKGLPLPNARVRFVSHQGWSKEVGSDEQGRATFQVIRDYFPPWDEFQKRFKANYLVIAEAAAAESGSHRDQPYTNVRYQATLSGSYYPSPNDYRSYAWGLGVGLLAMLFSGVAVYLYRRRRLKPFQEVRFDEKA